MKTKGWRAIRYEIFARLSSVLLFSGYSLLLTIDNLPVARAEQELKDFNYWASLCSAWEDAVNNQKYEDVLKACDNALALKSHQPQLWLARGNVLLALKQFPEAIASYEQVVTIEPKNSEGWTQQCSALLNLGKYAPAIADCERALHQDTNWGRATPAIAWNYRGEAWSHLDKFPEALSSFAWAIKLNPDYSLAWTNQCISLYQQSNFSTALASCDRALQINQFWGDSTASLGWANHAKVTLAMGLYDESLKDYNRALAINPKDATLETEYGLLLQQLGKYDLALAAYNQALDIAPEYSLALANKCATLTRLGKYPEAITSCETALQKSDGRWGKEGIALGWNYYGNALNGAARYEEALVAFNRAIAIAPNFATAWSNRSVTLWYQGKFDEALVCNQRAIDLAPNSSQVWYNQGRILTSLGRLTEATDAYNSSIKGDGNVGDNLFLAQVWVNQSAIFLRLQQYPEAIAASQSAIAINPQYSVAWYNEAVALTALSRYPDALNAYSRAIQIEPKNANFWAGKGISLRFMQKYPEALDAVKKALELDPNQPQALANRDILQQKLQTPSQQP